MKKTECKTCGSTDSTEFHLGNKSTCKKCKSIKNRAKYAALSPDHKKSYIRTEANRAKSDQVRYRWRQARWRANKKGMEFTIEPEDISFLLSIQNNRCAISNRLFNPDCGYDSWSVDRIDSSKGYTPDNIQLLTSMVNLMKNDATQEFFIEVVKDINKHLGLCN